ncbi:MAG: CHAD domain-containing protein [Gammaproteobacteria bacterium]|jgi:CHAD domain-containing protein
MTYRLRKNRSVQTSLRKVAREQIDRAIGEIADPDLERHEVVHQVRKRCKKLRGLIRLVRPTFDDYERENAFIRDTARELSYVRDAQSIIDCFDDLMSRFQDQIDRNAFEPIRDALAARRQTIAGDRVDLEERLEAALARLRELHQRTDGWQIHDTGFSAIEGGLLKTYGRGRKAMRNAYQDPSPASFHEWRKRAKYHWYHARLLRPIWPEMLAVHRAAADELSDLLGDDHDLAVLRQTLLETPGRFGGASDLQVILGLIDRRRAELEARARPLGQRLYAEKPKQLAARFGSYWKTWRATGKREPGLPD